MARIFITGAADGLGQLAATALVKEGHDVVLHARNEARGREALAKVPGAAGVLTADLSSIEETKALAVNVNATGTFDAVIHNAGVYQAPRGSVGAEGLSLLLTVNVLAPYVLTCLLHPPQRLVYLSSDMHRSGRPNLHLLQPGNRTAPNSITYSDTKLHDLMLALAVARRWPMVYSNAVNPGWVPTKMGGPGAPDDLQKGHETQAWLSVSDEPAAVVSGHYFFHKRITAPAPAADDIAAQDDLLSACERLTGVAFPSRGNP